MAKKPQPPTKDGKLPGDTATTPDGFEWYWDGLYWQPSGGVLDYLPDQAPDGP